MAYNLLLALALATAAFGGQADAPDAPDNVILVRAQCESVEGLEVGIDVWVRTAPQLDPEAVEPALASVAHEVLASYSAEEVASSRRREIERAIAAGLRPKLAAGGLRAVVIGDIYLPGDRRRVIES